MRAWRWVLCMVALGSLGGCGGGGPEAPPAVAKAASSGQPAAVKAPAQKSATPSVMPKTPAPSPPLAPLAYEPRGRRDPFVQVRLAKEKNGLEVGTVKLVGVISGSLPSALVEAPDGLGYIVKAGDVLGNGRVTAVSADSITFAVDGRSGQRETSLTLRMSKD